MDISILDQESQLEDRVRLLDQLLNGIERALGKKYEQERREMLIMGLLDVSPHRLQQAITLGVQRHWTFLPSLAEIYQLADECNDPVRMEKNREALTAAYDRAYTFGVPRITHTLPSVVDQAQFAPHGARRNPFIKERKAIAAAGGFDEFLRRRQIGPRNDVAAFRDLLALVSTPDQVKEVVLTRRQRIICGLEEAPPHDPVRLEMLRQQAAELQRQERRENSGYLKEWLSYQPTADTDTDLVGLS